MRVWLSWAHFVPKRLFIIPLVLTLSSLVLMGCPLSGPGGNTSDGSVVKREKDVSGKLALALGGLHQGADEIVINEEISSLELENNDPDLFDLEPRPDFESFAGGKGARVIPKKTGIGYVTPTVNGSARDPIEITISPQSLIQILLGEARGELQREATMEAGEAGDKTRVKSTSVSVTGDAVAATIRNRIHLIQLKDQPSLFVVDAHDFGSDPPQSFYDAVIEANNGHVYQYSPVEPDDPSFPVYQAASERESLGPQYDIAYDQAVLTAAGVFTGDTEDPTTGAFAFYSPTAAQYDAIRQGLESGDTSLPHGCGTSDSNFPALAPVQILVLDDIAPAVLGGGGGGVPSFVFVRSRKSSEPAITESGYPR